MWAGSQLEILQWAGQATAEVWAKGTDGMGTGEEWSGQDLPHIIGGIDRTHDWAMWQ